MAQVSLPYFNDFETDTAGWYTESVSGGPWQWAAPVAGSCTGSMMVGFGLNAAGSPGTFYSPVFNVAGIQDLVLCMSHRYATVQGWDGVRIEYAYDSDPWNILGSVGQGTNWYNQPAINSSALPAWSGNSSGCLNASIQVSPGSAYNTMQFRFVATFDDPTMPGLFVVDDFSLCVPSCACNGTVGTGSVSDLTSAFSISPNPVQDVFNWEFIAPAHNQLRIDIMDAAGRMVLNIFRGKITGSLSGSTDISTLAPGIYLIHVTGAGNTVSRLVKM